MAVLPSCTAVVLAGKPATGKTAALNTVLAALKATLDETSTVKLARVYPGVFEDLSDLFGRVGPSDEWEDGIFTSIFRKAQKVTSLTCTSGILISYHVR